jgi:hypothetical protein
MDPEHNLSFDIYLGEVSNLNLYFSSWAAFLLSIKSFLACLSVSMRSLTNIRTADNVSERHCSCTTWTALMVTSFVVMVASSRVYKDTNCDQSEGVIDYFDDLCARTKTGISFGTLGVVITAVWLMLSLFWTKRAMGSKVEFGVVVLLLIMWTCGVVLLTFDKNKSPGSLLGNLYFFTWGSWSLSVIMFMTSLQNIMEKSPSPDNSNTDTGTMKEDIEDEPAMENVMINKVDTEQGKAEAVGTEEGNAVGTEQSNTVGAEQDNAGPVISEDAVDIEQGNAEEVGMEQGISKEVITEQDTAGKVDMEQGTADAVGTE